MTESEIRAEAALMLAASIPTEDAVRFTFIQIMQMIEREGFEVPHDGAAFFGGEPLARRRR